MHNNIILQYTMHIIYNVLLNMVIYRMPTKLCQRSLSIYSTPAGKLARYVHARHPSIVMGQYLTVDRIFRFFFHYLKKIHSV